MHVDATRRNALTVTGIVSCAASALVAMGWNLLEFDVALVPYAIVMLVALGLTCYRLSIWAHRPPTRKLLTKGFCVFVNRVDLLGRSSHLARRSVTYLVLNSFLWKRGVPRWGAHFPIMAGCVSAFAIVVPLVFGWVWFETPPDDIHSYRVYVFGYHLRTIAIDGLEAFLAFHGLVWASVPVIIGTAMALWRRSRDRGDQATQRFGHDIMPLLLLMSIAVTGLLMTISYTFLQGFLHQPLTLLHFALVTTTLIWLPFSKLIHVPQRILKIAHFAYEYEGGKQAPAKCRRCRAEFAQLGHVRDLIEIQVDLGYDYAIDGPAEHYQWICPTCRRKMLVMAQSARWRIPAMVDDSGASFVSLEAR